MNRLFFPLLVALAVGPVFAATSYLPDSYLTSATNTPTLSFNDANPFPGANLLGPFPAGYGGAFQPEISGSTPATSAPVLTTVWCVDYQLDVEQGDVYAANITQLSQITPTNTNVQYNNLTTTQSSTSPYGSEAWANTVTDPANSSVDTNSAAYRYALAAALVSQYVSPSNDPDDPANPLNDAENRAIQTAIWYVTYNSDYSTPAGPWNTNPSTPGNSGGAPFNPTAYGVESSTLNTSNFLYWVSWAETNVDDVNLNDWAVISGPITGGALESPLNDGGVYQTFLVQLTPSGTTTNFGGPEPPVPEPAFYGLLALGLAALFMAARLRNAQAHRTA